MSLITRMRRQYATYWPPDHLDDDGQIVYGAPIEIRCRWEDVATEVVGRDGRTFMSKATVYVDQIVEVGGLLRCTKLEAILHLTRPMDNAGTYEIKSFSQIPNLRNTETLLTAYL